MDLLQDIIERCHQRHKKPFRQQKTVVTPAQHKSVPYQFKLYCARRTPIMLDALEQANISFMPIGRAPENDHAPRDFGGDRLFKRQGTQDWRIKRWFASWGIQIYTGIPSASDGAQWHDFEFKYQAICDVPDAVSNCIETLLKTTPTPLLTLTQSGGLRFTCRVPDYLHPDTDEARFYIYKQSSSPEIPHHRYIYLEIIGEKGYSCWDGRYEILLGNLLKPPVIAKEVLFGTMNVLRTKFHEPGSTDQTYMETGHVVPETLGSEALDLAKAAFLKRGFYYLWQDADFHHWGLHNIDGEDQYVSLWEDRDIVWVRGFTVGSEVPMQTTPITDIWNDTGITSSPVFTDGLPVSEKMLAVREGKLSPLAIKRSSTILQDTEPTRKVYSTLEKNAAQIRRVFDKDTRIVGIVTETVPRTNYEVEANLIKGGSTCLNIANRDLAEAAEQRYKALNLPSVARWRARMYRWEQVKDIPIDVRMANPFQHGNLCEDAERCRELEDKGGDARESICPHCPVYTECQQRGYLSQSLTFKHAKAQIVPHFQLFLDPRHAECLEQILETVDDTERICIIDERNANHLFIQCRLSKNLLKEWTLHWRGRIIGSFAEALLHALENKDDPNIVGRIRSIIHTFEQYEDELIQQMCHLNVKGKVVTHQFVDDETGNELAHWRIEFESGHFAYIPLNPHGEDRLRRKGLPVLSLLFFVLDEDIQIPLSMTDAITVGILDTSTVETIRTFPTVCKDPNWTHWHKLKRFFSHYAQDVDAPMHWNSSTLQFWIPPVLHPSVKRLLLISPTLSEHHLRRAFPSEEIECVHTKPIAWAQENQVFQIRTGIYSPRDIFHFDINLNTARLSKIAERIFWGIRAEIERDRNITHIVLANTAILNQVSFLKKYENVCFVSDLKTVEATDGAFEKTQVVWIVGTPHWEKFTIWQQAQMLFGNDKKPIHYEGDTEAAQYKDERVQSLFQQMANGLVAQTVGQAGLHTGTGKKVVLITSLDLPNITDRPETFLFDWEDFEIAGGLHKLTETVRTREQFEEKSANLTPKSSRKEVEQVLGCSARQANRVLQRLRGGKPLRIPLREQIVSLLANGEKKTAELLASIDAHSKAIDNELRQLVDAGEIVRVRRGYYALPDEEN